MFDKGDFYVNLIYKDNFIQGIIKGNLPKEVISQYLKADNIYLNNFSDIYAVLISKTKEQKLKKFFLSQINFIIEKEVIGAHKYFADYLGKNYSDIIKDGKWYPSVDHHIKHIYYNLYKYRMVETLSATLACPWIYKKVAEKILENHKLIIIIHLKNGLNFIMVLYVMNVLKIMCIL